MFSQKNHVKSLAVNAGEIKLTPRLFQAPDKRNFPEVCVYPHAFRLQTALKYVLSYCTACIVVDKRF